MDCVRRRLVIALAALVWTVSATADAAQAPTVDPWERDIAAFEAADRDSPPPKGEIVFIGSSTIRRWDVAASFPDLRIINRGFGGSTMADAARVVERIVIPYEPRLVVVYAGDNDIGSGQTSEQVTVQVERFVRAVHTKLPQTRIVFLGIKPSVLRWSQIDRMRIANEMIRSFCERDDRLAFLDLGPVMLGWDERPRPELFVEDGLHLSPQGYQLWTMALRPFLAPPPSTR